MKREHYDAITRHLLGALGAFAAATGLWEDSLVTSALGALGTLAAVGWSLWEKRSTKH